MKKYMTIEEFLKTQSMSLEKNNKRKLLKHILAILCLSIILFSVYTILDWHLDNTKIRQLNQKINKSININNNNNKTQGELINPPKNKESDYYYYAKFPFYQIDFSNLMSQNNEIIAFIHMDNTNINYPVVQTSNNDYYLNHTFDKKVNNAGWIFMDYRNDIMNLNDNTIIYGHARLDGTMFGTLRNTLTSYWQDNKDNYVIYLSTLKENMIFQIFSIYTIKKESYYITPNFSSDDEKNLWLKTMKKRNIGPINTEVDVNDKILTLSTCQNNKDGRIVIQAKLIKKQKI